MGIEGPWAATRGEIGPCPKHHEHALERRESAGTTSSSNATSVEGDTPTLWASSR